VTTPAALPTVTLVVAMRNEARHIARCVDSLLAQDYPADRLEVLFMDGRSTDDTRAIVAARIAGRPGTSASSERAASWSASSAATASWRPTTSAASSRPSRAPAPIWSAGPRAPRARAWSARRSRWR
jgi:glycosyltransferase involved in cell wall biosynthesis